MRYKAIISSDWNECLAPSGPFDPIAFVVPGAKTGLERNLYKIYEQRDTAFTGRGKRTGNCCQRL